MLKKNGLWSENIPNSSWEMKNYQLSLGERDWQRFNRRCFFFLVQWWKTYQLFCNHYNRGRVRVGELHKSTLISRLNSWFAFKIKVNLEKTSEPAFSNHYAHTCITSYLAVLRWNDILLEREVSYRPISDLQVVPQTLKYITFERFTIFWASSIVFAWVWITALISKGEDANNSVGIKMECFRICVRHMLSSSV